MVRLIGYNVCTNDTKLVGYACTMQAAEAICRLMGGPGQRMLVYGVYQIDDEVKYHEKQGFSNT